MYFMCYIFFPVGKITAPGQPPGFASQKKPTTRIRESKEILNRKKQEKKITTALGLNREA